MLIDIYAGLIIKLGQTTYNEAWLMNQPEIAHEILLKTRYNYNDCKNNAGKCMSAFEEQKKINNEYNTIIKSKSLQI